LNAIKKEDLQGKWGRLAVLGRSLVEGRGGYKVVPMFNTKKKAAVTNHSVLVGGVFKGEEGHDAGLKGD